MSIPDMRAVYKALTAERVRFHVLDFMDDLDEEGWRALLGVRQFCTQNKELKLRKIQCQPWPFRLCLIAASFRQFLVQSSSRSLRL